MHFRVPLQAEQAKNTIQNREKNFKAKEKVKIFSLILKAWKRTFSFAIKIR